jgi:Tol biopolymer transport system component
LSPPLSPGSRFGLFDIQAPLGEGGMGAVFRARDTKLGRDVAIKVLLPEVANSPERLTRFQREAQVLAALNHPYIAAIYGVEESGGITALIMELVEGDDLSERIGTGPMPLQEALRIATQIVEALEAAHEQGIVHRDLKPANIRIRRDGTVKVLDFGLAKAIAPASGIGSPSSRGGPIAATATSPAMMTDVGVILGTAAYMSPEQARGAMVDRRADLWAFGVILFEMLAGQRLFEGATVSDTLASILKTDPDWSLLPANTPVAIRRLLRRCLQKDRRDRLDSSADARIEIQEALAPTTSDATDPVPARVAAAAARLPWAVAAATSVACVALLVAWISGSPRAIVDRPVMEFEITPPEGTTFGPVRSTFRVVSVSPDGRQLAMVAGPRDGKPMLWIRPLASNTPRAIAGTENATHPFWSPDGKWVGFIASGRVKRVDPNGAQPQAIADTNRSGGAFNRAGVLLLTRNDEPLLRASSTGGGASALFPLDGSRKETAQYDPVFLPDGNHLLYFSLGPEMGIAYASLDGSVRKFLFPQQNSPADFAPDSEGGDGWLLYNVAGQLVARRFNPATGAVGGEPGRLADNVAGGPTFSVSTTGVLTFRRGSQSKRQLVWFTRDGKQQNALGEAATGVGVPHISPDGGLVAVHRNSDGNADIWLEAATGGTATRLTFEPGADMSPVWSADGQRLYYMSDRDDRFHLVERSATGLDAERVLLQADPGTVAQPISASRDGRWLVLRTSGAGHSSIVFRSLVDGKAVRLPETASVSNGTLSPDGRWFVYEMTSGSTSEVFVRGVPPELNGSAADAKRQISTAGARQPIWRADGKEILYITLDGTVMAVPVETTHAGFRSGSARALFKAGEGATLDVTADGQRFLINRGVSESDPPVTVMVNWPSLLKQ